MNDALQLFKITARLEVGVCKVENVLMMPFSSLRLVRPPDSAVSQVCKSENGSSRKGTRYCEGKMSRVLEGRWLFCVMTGE
jgi:hypothetical protein